MTRDELIAEYKAQGYTQKHAEFLADKATPLPQVTTVTMTDPRPDLPGKPPGSVPAPRKQRANDGRRSVAPAKPAAAAPRAPRTAASRRNAAEVRKWAKANGVAVPARGAIPKLVRERYEEEMGSHA